jgi:hypothetical protein
MLNYWRYLAKQGPSLATHVMRILMMLSMIDAPLWLKILQPEFEDLFFAMAVESVGDQHREAVWNAMEMSFNHSCLRSFTFMNGNSEQSDSDTESKMEIDHHPPDQSIVGFLWQVTINCLKRAGAHILLAGKAFDTAATMLR